MTNEQKEKIIELRKLGIGYRSIELSTLDWTTPMREVIVKLKQVGDFFMTRLLKVSSTGR
ncbi:hypothetical protein [Kurthia gibsonii]|uniref:hypothetical protein n=1 Tax=Kurthia gibsonii TaxID=33946 RepID=UPI0031B69C70